MNALDEKPYPNDQPPSPETRQIIEEYLNSLREMIRKLRRKLN